MLSQRVCPYCGQAAVQGCRHLALAVPGREFVHKCVESAGAERQWNALCRAVRSYHAEGGGWTPDTEDFMWLETAFCDRFLKPLRWFGSMDHEWRSSGAANKGDFFVLLWSHSRDRLWWELHDWIETQLKAMSEREIEPSKIGTQLTGNDPMQRTFADRPGLATGGL